MAESFSNSITKTVGVVTSYTGSTIGAAGTTITVTANTGIGVSDLVVNNNFTGGTKVKQIESTTIYTDTASSNESSASSQVVKFLGVTTVYTSAAATKSIVIGGTLTNNENGAIKVFVETRDSSAGVDANLVYNAPIPEGSSMIISDAGKTVLEATDELRVYCDTKNGVDVNFSILSGVS
tara:strand:+ start:61 stop:600 length:540 start_codon:yes stop_codon:yes gene_type:complete